MITVVLAQARRRYGCLALHLVDADPLFVHAVRALRADPALRHAPTVVAVPREVVAEVVAVGKDVFSDPPLTVVGTDADCLDLALHDVLAELDELGAVQPADRVLVHDLRRAFVEPELVARVVAAGADGAAVVPVHHLVETVKQVDRSGRVLGTVARETLAHLQTPQSATFARLQAVHRNCPPGGDRSLLGLVGAVDAPRQVTGDVSAALVGESGVSVIRA